MSMAVAQVTTVAVHTGSRTIDAETTPSIHNREQVLCLAGTIQVKLLQSAGSETI